MKIFLIIIVWITFLIGLVLIKATERVRLVNVTATTLEGRPLDSLLQTLLSPNFIFENIDKIRVDANENLKVSANVKLFGIRESSLTDRTDIKFHGRADVSKRHKIVIAVKQSNLDLLEDLVNDISDPDSDNFGKVKTRDEIVAITNHIEASEHIIRYLNRHWREKGHVVIERSAFGEYISGESNNHSRLLSLSLSLTYNYFSNSNCPD